MSKQNHEKLKDFTVYIEGHEGHRGNVLGHAYISKLSKLLIVLAKLERLYLDGAKKTDFEIVGAEKYNPTTITLKPVPRVQLYDPHPAFDWSIEQIELVGKGNTPDRRLRSPIVRDLVDLSQESTDNSYKKFWINGHADPIHFDEHYYLNALTLARKLARDETPFEWYAGVSAGEVVGRLEKIDNLDADHEFMIVPPVGAEKIRCKFPVSMEENIGAYMFKMVRVTGSIHYTEMSPHPDKIDVVDGGISLVDEREKGGKLRDLRGIFKGSTRNPINLESLFGG